MNWHFDIFQQFLHNLNLSFIIFVDIYHKMLNFELDDVTHSSESLKIICKHFYPQFSCFICKLDLKTQGFLSFTLLVHIFKVSVFSQIPTEFLKYFNAEEASFSYLLNQQHVGILY